MAELKQLFFKNNKKAVLKINPDDVPTLVPKDKMNKLLSGDENPYFKIEAIDYPIVANGYNYVESFFEEFISKTKERPMPGSRDGHHLDWGKRPPTDLFMVGGKLEKKKNGKGTVYFKNYIPPMGESGDNSAFIKLNQVDMIHYSLVSYTRDEVMREKDKVTINVVGSVKGERNDAVEYGLGAMDQKTNSVRIINATVGSEENDNKGVQSMTKEELLQKMNAFFESKDLTISEIVKHLNQEDRLVTDKHLNAVAIVEEFNKIGVDDPVKAYNDMLEKEKADQEVVFNSLMTENFGPEKHANGKDNLVREYAAGKLEKVSAEKMNEAIEELKKDNILLSLQADVVDVDSDVNKIGKTEKKNKDDETPLTGRKIVSL